MKQAASKSYRVKNERGGKWKKYEMNAQVNEQKVEWKKWLEKNSFNVNENEEGRNWNLSKKKEKECKFFGEKRKNFKKV